MFLDQLQTEGYTILVVTGILPNCTADNEAGLVPIPPPGSLKVVKKATVARNNSDSDDIARAIAMSLGNDNCDQVVDSDLDQAIKASMMDTDDDNLSVSHALAESLNQSSQSSSNAKRPAFQMAASAPSAAELEQIRLSRISRFSK